MKVAFYTLGCKVNQYETESMRELFRSRGHDIVSENGGFDALVINSCTVTAESDRKTRQALHRFRRSNPFAVILLTGCMVQAFPEESASLTDADIVIGNTDIEKTVSLTESVLADRRRIADVEKHLTGERFNTPAISEFAERTRAYMKIEDGCDRFCSYCIIPTARGRVRSRSLSDITAEAQRLAAGGFPEIVLVGINLSAYGMGEGLNLCDAVKAVCAVDGIKRVRLGSLEPDHITDEILEGLREQEKFCPQFHLSLQSGCNATLKRMNRHYDADFYRELVRKIRSTFDNPSVTTDVMVGFAGETDEEFAESLEFVKSMGFAKTHVFAYSRRSGTVAFGMKGQLTRAEKEQRSRIMISAARESEATFLRSQTGLCVPVLFEASEDGFAEGYTPNYSRVKVKSEKKHTGEIRNVKIVSALEEYCIGEEN